MSSGLFLSSGVLFSIAKQAYDRAKAEVSHERSHESNEPLVGIIFAAAAGEAFINEIGELASQSTFKPEPVQIQNLGYLLSEVEASHGTTNLKFMIAKHTLTGKFFDKGSNPYQNFVKLMELRNSIMHLKFDRIKSVKINDAQINHPPIINKLPRNILADFEGEKKSYGKLASPD